MTCRSLKPFRTVQPRESMTSCKEIAFAFSLFLIGRKSELACTELESKSFRPMFPHVTRSHLCWQLLLFAEGRLMDPSVVATAGSAAVVAVNDQTSGATRSAAEQSQDHVVQGRAALQGRTNDYPQEDQGKHTDGRTTNALPHQVRQDESHGSFSS